MCKKQTAVSHSSTESEIISLDTGLRLDGLPALELWDLIVSVFGFFSCFRSIGETWEWWSQTPQVSQQNRCDKRHWCCSFKCPIRASRSFIVCVWGQWSCDQDDHKGKKSYNETCFPEPTDLLSIGCLIESNWTPKIQNKYIDTKNQLADILTKGNFTRDEWNHLLCSFSICQFSSINKCKALSKRSQEDAGEQSVTAKSKPMANLVSRCGVRDPTVLASTASENKSESLNVPLSSLNVLQTSAGRPVLLASSSDYSEWNNDDKWSSQVKKYGEMSRTSTGRPVSNKLVIDIDMDSDTAAESDLSPKSSSFLNRVNHRLRKMLDRSPEDSMQDIDKRFMIWWMFMSSTVEASVFMGKNYSDNLHSIKKSENLTLKQMFEIIWTVDIGTIRWDFWSVSNQLGKFSMETVLSGQWWTSHHQSLSCKGLRILRFSVMSWKDESEPNIKFCLGRKIELVQEFITKQSFGHN